MSLMFSNLVFLIPLIPIVAAFIALFFGNKIDRPHHGNLVTLVALGFSLVLTILASGEVVLRLLFGDHVDPVKHAIEWLSIGDFSFDK